jgi:putative transposase
MVMQMVWNLDPPPSFRGLDEKQPLTCYTRHLPHWRQPGATYFVTFRQADSIPQEKLLELKQFRTEWEMQNPKPRTKLQLESIGREVFRRIETWLDLGIGSCRIRSSEARKILTDSRHHFCGEKYELGCFVAMPNHVHLVVRPFANDDEALSRITHGWKRHSALHINRLFSVDGTLWQDESYDRIVRDEEHLWRVIQYIGNNPAKAKLESGHFERWINPEWARMGWGFDAEQDDPSRITG